MLQRGAQIARRALLPPLTQCHWWHPLSESVSRSRHSNPRLWPRDQGPSTRSSTGQWSVTTKARKAYANQEPAPARPRTSDRSSAKFRTTINSAKHSCANSVEGVNIAFEFSPADKCRHLTGRKYRLQCAPRRLSSRLARRWRFLGAAIGRHAAFDCWRGNGINLSMLSRARHESSPRPCAIKNLRKGSQETRMQDIPAETKKRGPSSRVLQEVIRQAPAEYVTVGWLTSTLHRHSFGRGSANS
jgi:hypothetical protein